MNVQSSVLVKGGKGQDSQDFHSDLHDSVHCTLYSLIVSKVDEVVISVF